MSSICECPQPPGGRVVCNTDQMAVCRVKNGQAKYLCLSPPLDAGDLEIVNWAVASITEETRYPDLEISETHINLLDAGSFSNTRFSVTFTLPRSVLTAVKNLRDRNEEPPLLSR